jgi:hypothetical protein
MNDATERLYKRCRRCLERCVDLDCIHRRDSDELGKPAGQTSDAVLAIKLTLVTVVRSAILTKDLAPATDAIQALIDYNAIAFVQIVDCASDLLDDAGDLVS